MKEKDIKYTVVYKEDKWKTLVVNLGIGVCSGILFLVLLFGLHWNLFIDMILTVGCYFGFSMVCKPQKKIGNVSMEQIAGGENLERQMSVDGVSEQIVSTINLPSYHAMKKIIEGL